MKHNYQHIFKKTYAKPVIEEVMIDREMSLVMDSTPVNPGPPTGPINPEAVIVNDRKELPTYRSATLQSPTSPFGSSPDY